MVMVMVEMVVMVLPSMEETLVVEAVAAQLVRQEQEAYTVVMAVNAGLMDLELKTALLQAPIQEAVEAVAVETPTLEQVLLRPQLVALVDQV